MMARLGDIVSISASIQKLDGNQFWLLNLDMVEQQTGNVISYKYVSSDKLDGSIIQFDTKNVLYSKLRPNLNKVVVPYKPGFATSEMLPLKPDTNVLTREYLAAYLRSSSFVEWAVSKTAGAKMPRLGIKELLNKDMPVPTLKEQEHITKILKKIDSLISLRKQQVAKLDELVKARFVEMFGDPVQNPFGWTTKPLLEMGYCKNGMNFHTGDSGIEMHCLGVGDFKDYSVIDGTDYLPTVSLNEVPPEESMLQDGDIVFVRSNGNKALVGRCLVVYPRNTPTTYSGFCIRYRLTSGEVNTIYLLRVLKTDSMRKKMAGRGANIQNLNQQILATLNIPTPPLELQEQFSAVVEQTNKSKLVIQQSLDRLEVLKKSLMQEYFMG